MNTADTQYDFARLAEQYSGLSDTQLLIIAADRKSLTEVASSALDAELSRRKLSGDAPDEFAPREIDAKTTELPYRWGKFVGGSMVVQGILVTFAGIAARQWILLLATAFLVTFGFGVYEKKKWAVVVVESITAGVAILIAIVLFVTAKPAAVLFGFIQLGCCLPQTIYFWKRRNELR